MLASADRPDRAWHALDVTAVAAALGTDLDAGLSTREAERRRIEVGPNSLKDGGRPSAFRIACGQFSDFMVLVLLVAAGISWALGDAGDAAAILAIVGLNAALGFFQEYRAERSLEALRDLAAPTATVVRDGEPAEVKAKDVVPGDLLLIEVGDRIPADARIIAEMSLEVEESALTGESLPVAKRADQTLPAACSVGDRRNMVFMGTMVTRGRARALVVATGMATEIGRIARMISEEREDATPLQQRLARLGRTLVIVCVTLCAIVSVAGVLRGEPTVAMFLTGVSLAVAAIPEGLPAVVTIALALGVQRMGRRNAIVRRLPAVETLGCTTVICSDKTGTLTRNEMTLVELAFLDRSVEVTGAGFSSEGGFFKNGSPVDPRRDPVLTAALEVGLYCNNALLTRDGEAVRAAGRPAGRRGVARAGSRWNVVGDPTEGALLVAAAKAGLARGASGRAAQPAYEVPFDSRRKRMTSVYRGPRGLVAYVKGAPEVVLDLCAHAMSGGAVRPLTRADRRRIIERSAEMAARGLRVLGLAYRELGRASAPAELDERSVESELVFVALAGIADPPRHEVKKAIATARNAGVRTIMVTGDHAGTALACARALGLADGDASALTGSDLDAMDDASLSSALARTQVFARVSPEHKLRIVRALRTQGHVVAMTGDGVNDAPAVKEADIGIAMGLVGTDVTREAAAMVLADDNYATIVAAVEEGRAIYDNIRKFIRYLLACNAGEVLTMLAATLLGLPLPLAPLQILWMNLVTDGLPAIALGADPADPDVMARKPRKPREGVFSRGLGIKIAAQGVFIGACTIMVFAASLALGADLARARTVAFTSLVMAQLFYVFHCRSEHRSIAEIDLRSNPYLIAAAAVSCAMQLSVLYWPAAQRVFHTTPLGMLDWLMVLVSSGWSSMMGAMARSVRNAIKRHLAMVRA